MSVTEQARVVVEVERQGRGKQRRLRELGVPRSTYYWWRRQHQVGTNEAMKGRRSPWNRLQPEEEALAGCGRKGSAAELEGRGRLLGEVSRWEEACR